MVKRGSMFPEWMFPEAFIARACLPNVSQFHKTGNIVSSFVKLCKLCFRYTTENFNKNPSMRGFFCFIFLIRLMPLILKAWVSCLRSAYHALTKKFHFVSRLEIKPIQNSTKNLRNMSSLSSEFQESRRVFRSFHFRPFLMRTSQW